MNGKAESAVKIIKNMMIRTRKEGQDQNEVLLELRNTLCQDTGLSPAQMMFGRETRSMLLMLSPKKTVRLDKHSSRKISIQKSYDERARDLPILEKGQSMYFDHKKVEQWSRGKTEWSLIHC